MNDAILDRWAKVILDIGLDVRKGQNLVINAPLEALRLVRKIVLMAYRDKHVRYVVTNFTDECISSLRIEHSDEEYLGYVPEWEHDYLMERSNVDMAEINLRTCNPSASKGYDLKRFNAVDKALMQMKKGYRKNFNSGKINWVSLLYPTEEWAQAVYPEVDSGAALDRLWQDVIKINRLDFDDPVNEWNIHKEKIAELKNKLDELNIGRLHFEGPGTDLNIELVSGGRWAGGAIKNGGNEFIPNIPTEEVFHLPHKYGVNGRVKATLPLNYQGNVIAGIEMEFKEGKIAWLRADKGEDILRSIVAVDEGASHLGEVALVSVKSPIYASKRIFMTTLYDENAVCHIALGNYASCVVDGIEDMSVKESDERGINRSLIHVDFMIGSENMDVVAFDAEGRATVIMKNGDWKI